MYKKINDFMKRWWHDTRGKRWRTSSSFPKIQKYCILAIKNVRFLQIYKKIPEYTFLGPRYSTVCDNHNQALITFRYVITLSDWQIHQIASLLDPLWEWR